MRYELADFEWTAIKPMLPNKPRWMRNQRNEPHVGSGSKASLWRSAPNFRFTLSTDRLLHRANVSDGPQD